VNLQLYICIQDAIIAINIMPGWVGSLWFGMFCDGGFSVISKFVSGGRNEFQQKHRDGGGDGARSI
jgi:hypothetical protein